MKPFLVNWIAITSAAALLLVQTACSSATTREQKELTHTERAQLLIDIANGALAEGDATGALQNLSAAEKEDARLPELYHSKALAFFQKHDLDDAIAAARKAVEIKSDYSDANNTLGKLLIDRGNGDQATAPLLLAANDPLYRDAYKPFTNLGILYYRRGDYAHAEDYFTRAIEKSPNGACVAFYYRGHLRLRATRFPEAVKDYDSAGKRTCANFADAHLAMGIAYERNKQFDLARKKYLEIQARYPKSQIAEQAMSHLRLLP